MPPTLKAGTSNLSITFLSKLQNSEEFGGNSKLYSGTELALGKSILSWPQIISGLLIWTYPSSLNTLSPKIYLINATSPLSKRSYWDPVLKFLCHSQTSWHHRYCEPLILRHRVYHKKELTWSKIQHPLLQCGIALKKKSWVNSRFLSQLLCCSHHKVNPFEVGWTPTYTLECWLRLQVSHLGGCPEDQARCPGTISTEPPSPGGKSRHASSSSTSKKSTPLIRLNLRHILPLSALQWFFSSLRVQSSMASY